MLLRPLCDSNRVLQRDQAVFMYNYFHTLKYIYIVISLTFNGPPWRAIPDKFGFIPSEKQELCEGKRKKEHFHGIQTRFTIVLSVQQDIFGFFSIYMHRGVHEAASWWRLIGTHIKHV